MGSAPHPARRSNAPEAGHGKSPLQARAGSARASRMDVGIARPPARISLIDRQGGLKLSPTFKRGAAIAIALAASLAATAPAAHAAPSAAERLATVARSAPTREVVA